MRALAIAIMGAMLVAIGGAFAQDNPVPRQYEGMIGNWRLEQQDETLPACALRFTADEAIGGWALEVPAPCAAPYPAADSMVAWNIDDSDGSVILLDALRHVTLRLFEDEDGLYDTDPQAPPQLYLLFDDEAGVGVDGASSSAQ